ncbi:divergent polysaccharide deacetylase family protein [Sulfuriflexus sp.]|uniref:divergent polysaccharide deacetylase family protein n=1 Tax=Sulfuriflexus sp. TaxID=2015443 RepID=UPI0028CE6893|nr:divergent polysaccharide deacetylase family protein [Sulfuriflexus sp.]MDT8404428.1 divergent polysaccharide deacetylase family protein [Sulfuriflexus sp.]
MQRWRKTLLVTGMLLSSGMALAQRPAIAIIIDDLGNNAHDERAVELPGAVACAFLPHAPYTNKLARKAHSVNKEVMLHAPMEALHGNALGPGSLTLHMTERQFTATLQDDLAAVPHVQGINNHMGSLLTRHPGHMLWLMQEMTRHGNLFFVDSRTTVSSVARTVAAENRIPNLERDIFLDAEPGEAFVERQFARLVKVAKQRGTALAIGHPYPATMKVLKQRLQELDEMGVDLVAVGELIQRKQQELPAWQLSSSPLPKVAKNSKP